MKQHVSFRNYDAGKGKFLISLRLENRCVPAPINVGNHMHA